MPRPQGPSTPSPSPRGPAHSLSPLESPAPHTHLPSHPPVPTMAPRNVAVHGPTATQLDVTWEPPPLESQNGDIQGYKVRALPPRRGSRGPRPGWRLGVTQGRGWERPPGLHPRFVCSPQGSQAAETKVHPPPCHVLGRGIRPHPSQPPSSQRQHQTHAKQPFVQPP